MREAGTELAIEEAHAGSGDSGGLLVRGQGLKE